MPKIFQQFSTEVSSASYRVRLPYISALLTGVLCLSGCYLSVKGSSKDALALANAFHTEMAHDDLAGIYSNADSRYRDAVPRAKSDALFSVIARKLGTPEDCTQGDTTWKVATWGTTITSVCQTDFSKKAQATETFVWIKSGNQLRLLSYRINSDALIER